MKILFIVPGYKPGKDGVGDYTRRLSQKLESLGHETFVIAWSDPFVHFPHQAENFLTLPRNFSENTKRKLAESVICQFDPAVINVQWVPYGYHPKGLFGTQIRSFRRLIKNRSVQLMIHEIWLGAKIESSRKEKILGKFQKHLHRKLVQELTPSTVFTQCEAYHYLLKIEGIDAKILPLFSNVPVIDTNDRSREGQLTVGFFGSIHTEANLEDLLPELIRASKQLQRKLRISHAGRNSDSGKALWNEWKNRWREETEFAEHGELSLEDASFYLSSLDLGLSPNPYALTDKSGVVAAMIEHELPVIVIRDDVHFDGFSGPEKLDSILLKPNSEKIVAALKESSKISQGDPLLFAANQLIDLI